MPLQPPRPAVAWRQSKPAFAGGHNHSEGILRYGGHFSGAVRALAETLLPPGVWRWEAEAGGRPRVVSAAGERGPDVSLSHCADLLAAAVVEGGRTGIDVEIAGRRRRNWPALAAVGFSLEERRLVERDGEDAFLAFWTLREATAKLGDGGLSAALALDGALILSARQGVAVAGARVVGHRRMGSLHLALAWEPEFFVPQVERRLSATLDAFVADCGHGSISL